MGDALLSLFTFQRLPVDCRILADVAALCIVKLSR